MIHAYKLGNITHHLLEIGQYCPIKTFASAMPVRYTDAVRYGLYISAGRQGFSAEPAWPTAGTLDQLFCERQT